MNKTNNQINKTKYHQSLDVGQCSTRPGWTLREVFPFSPCDTGSFRVILDEPIYFYFHLKMKEPLVSNSGGSLTMRVSSVNMDTLQYVVMASSPSIKTKDDDSSLNLTRSGV